MVLVTKLFECLAIAERHLGHLTAILGLKTSAKQGEWFYLAVH